MDKQPTSLVSSSKSEEISRCWYVYYKLEAGEVQGLQPHISALLTSMQQKYAVLARLHQRREFARINSAIDVNKIAADTWMETYEESPETRLRLQGKLFADVLTQAVHQTPALAPFAARRHIECFMEMPICA